MKVNEIRDNVFGAARDWSLYGFLRMPDYANLYTHASWPGLIFRRVANVRQAMLFGGVIFGDDNYEVLYASKLAGGVGNWKVGLGVAAAVFEFNKTPFFVRGDQLGFFAGEAEACSAMNTDGVVDDSFDIAINPKYAMAVVSNISMLGFRAKTSVAKGTFFNGTSTVSGIKEGSLALSGGGLRNPALPPLKQYLVQWAELPFAQNGGDFVRKAVPDLARDYPSSIRSQMSSLLSQVASDPVANPDGDSTFVLTRVTTSERASPVWGGIIRGVYLRGEVGYHAYATVTSEPSEGGQPELSRKIEEISGPFYDSARKTLMVPGDLVISGGFGTEDLPATLKVATNFSIDMTKFHQEFAPAMPVPDLSGEKNYFDLIKSKPVSTASSTDEAAAVGNRPGRKRLLEPMGLRSVEVDLQNLLTRAEAIVLDERLYAATTGTAFGDATGQPDVVPLLAQSTGYIYTKAIAEGRGDKSGRHVGALVYESAGIFVVPEDGIYELLVHTGGTALLDNYSGHGIYAQGAPKQVFLVKGAIYTIEASSASWSSWFVNENQKPSLWGFSGPNLVLSQWALDKGTSSQYGFTSDTAPSHGLRGSNGVVCGTRQQVQGGPIGLPVVAVRMVSRG